MARNYRAHTYRLTHLAFQAQGGGPRLRRGACSPGLTAETVMTRKTNVQLFANLLNNLQRNSAQRQLMRSLSSSLSLPSCEAVDAKRFARKV